MIYDPYNFSNPSSYPYTLFKRSLCFLVTLDNLSCNSFSADLFILTTYEFSLGLILIPSKRRIRFRNISLSYFTCMTSRCSELFYLTVFCISAPNTLTYINIYLLLSLDQLVCDFDWISIPYLNIRRLLLNFVRELRPKAFR